MMTYEGLAEGGFQTGTMMGSGGFIVLDEDQCVVRHTFSLAGSIATKAAVNVHPVAKARAGWKRSCITSNTEKEK
jgi:NADH-quinone oxidoreductase subunit F